MIRKIILLIMLLPGLAIAGDLPKADFVLVKKHEKRLYLMKNKKPFKTYRVAFGANSKGPKIMEGDERTPEGTYILDYKNPDSDFYKSIHISYPNDKDIKRAREMGVVPGGDIMIHGQKNGSKNFSRIQRYVNWTDGCIAVTNAEMDEIWTSVDVGTPITIEP
ncbi:MAG TPA: L,D-transpeptidase family protein [Desulfobacterales bacterium]|nr:L,D-transpeptidase family protein [Desulfobacterales bacterium]